MDSDAGREGHQLRGGTGVVCNSTDTSMFCNFTKFMSVIMNLFFLCIIVFIVYNFFANRRTIFSGVGPRFFR